MISRHTIRGRRELAQTVTTDVVLLLISGTMLLMRLHHRDNFYDVAGLLAHIFLHSITCTFALVMLKFTIASSSLLRGLLVLYVLTFIADALLLFGFAFLYFFHDHRASIDVYYATLHVATTLGFIVVDLTGAFFVDLAYTYIDSLVYADNGAYLHAVAQQVLASRNFVPDKASGRLGSVHITTPPALAMSSGRTLNSHLNV